MVDLLITDAEASAIWKRVSGYKPSSLNNLYKRDVSEFLADRKTLLAEVSRLTLALAEATKEPDVPVIILGDPRQVSADIYWFALDPANGSYAATEATLSTSLSGRITTLAAIGSPTQAQRNELSELRSHGAYANVDGGNGYTGLKIVGPCYGLNGLSIVAAGLCRDIFNYICSVNPNSAATTYHTNSWGDQYQVWGKFLRAPARLPTTGEDARIADAKGNGSKTIMYVATTATGTGSGNSYLNRKAIVDFNLSTIDYDIIVLCGEIYSPYSVGAASFYVKSGSSDLSRTQVVSHPTDRAIIYTGRTFTSWTNEGGGVWSKNTAATISDTFIVTSAGGTRRGLTKVASLAACQAAADTSYVTGSTVYVNISADPAGNTFIPTSLNFALLTRTLQYADFFGIELRQYSSVGSFHFYHTDIAFYACSFKTCGRGFSMLAHKVNPKTGRFQESNSADSDFSQTFKPWIRRNLIIKGCHFENMAQVVYDSTTNNDSGFGVIFCDNYCYKLNSPAAENFGYDLTTSADSHAIACYGGINGWTIENNCMERAGNQNIVIYGTALEDYPPSRVLSDGAFTNGEFTTDLTGWTDNDTGTGASTQTGGKLRLNGGASGVAKRTQAVTIGAGYVGNDENGVARHQVIRIETGTAISMKDNDYGPRIYVDVGTTDSANDLFNGTTSTVRADQDGIAAFYFVPTGTTFYVSLYNPNNSDLDITAVTLLQDLLSETGYQESSGGHPPSAMYEPGGAGALVSPKLNMIRKWTEAQNISIKYNWIFDPNVTGVDVGAGVGIDLGGDASIAGYNSRQRNITISRNRIEGNGIAAESNYGLGAAIRTKLKPFDVGASNVLISNNVIRGVYTAFSASTGFAYDTAGNKVSPSFTFENNDAHALVHYVQINEVAAALHALIMRNNTYRIQSGVLFGNIVGTTTNLTTFQGQQQSGDVLESGSTHVAL